MDDERKDETPREMTLAELDHVVGGMAGFLAALPSLWSWGAAIRLSKFNGVAK